MAEILLQIAARFRHKTVAIGSKYIYKVDTCDGHLIESRVIYSVFMSNETGAMPSIASQICIVILGF